MNERKTLLQQKNSVIKQKIQRNKLIIKFCKDLSTILENCEIYEFSRIEKVLDKV